MNYLGVDIGGTEVKLGIVNEQGTVLSKNSFSVAFDGYETPILTTVLKSAALFLEQQGVCADTLGGIGVSATGQIDTVQGVVAGTAGHIKNWMGAPIKQAFEEKFGKKTTVLNDANSVVLAEHWVGRAKGYTHVVAVTIGTGVGGGVIVEDRLLGGARGIAGELGHIMINHDAQGCTCGNRGCYEQYASMTALVKKVRLALPELALGNVKPEEINGKRIFRYLWEGHAGITRLVDEWVGCIADGLIGLVHIFNPQLILLGGGVSREGEPFLSLVRKKVLEGVMSGFVPGLELAATSLGNDAGLVGAVRSCL